jgi:hypothetical protein
MVVLALSEEQLFYLRKANVILEAALTAPIATEAGESIHPHIKVKRNLCEKRATTNAIALQDFVVVQDSLSLEQSSASTLHRYPHEALAGEQRMYFYPPTHHMATISSVASSSLSPLTTCESHASLDALHSSAASLQGVPQRDQPSDLLPSTYKIHAVSSRKTTQQERQYGCSPSTDRTVLITNKVRRLRSDSETVPQALYIACR